MAGHAIIRSHLQIYMHKCCYIMRHLEGTIKVDVLVINISDQVSCKRIISHIISVIHDLSINHYPYFKELGSFQ